MYSPLLNIQLEALISSKDQGKPEFATESKNNSTVGYQNNFLIQLNEELTRIRSMNRSEYSNNSNARLGSPSPIESRN